MGVPLLSQTFDVVPKTSVNFSWCVAVLVHEETLGSSSLAGFPLGPHIQYIESINHGDFYKTIALIGSAKFREYPEYGQTLITQKIGGRRGSSALREGAI